MYQYFVFSVLVYLIYMSLREIIYKEGAKEAEYYIIFGLATSVIMQTPFGFIMYIKLVVIVFLSSMCFNILSQNYRLLFSMVFTGLASWVPMLILVFLILLTIEKIVIKIFNQNAIEAKMTRFAVTFGISVVIFTILQILMPVIAALY